MPVLFPIYLNELSVIVVVLLLYAVSQTVNHPTDGNNFVKT